MTRGLRDIVLTKQEEAVEVRVRSDGRVLWVNIGGECVLRVALMMQPKPRLVIEDER